MQYRENKKNMLVVRSVIQILYAIEQFSAPFSRLLSVMRLNRVQNIFEPNTLPVTCSSEKIIVVFLSKNWVKISGARKATSVSYAQMSIKLLTDDYLGLIAEIFRLCSPCGGFKGSLSRGVPPSASDPDLV